MATDWRSFLQGLGGLAQPLQQGWESFQDDPWGTISPYMNDPASLGLRGTVGAVQGAIENPPMPGPQNFADPASLGIRALSALGGMARGPGSEFGGGPQVQDPRSFGESAGIPGLENVQLPPEMAMELMGPPEPGPPAGPIGGDFGIPSADPMARLMEQIMGDMGGVEDIQAPPQEEEEERKPLYESFEYDSDLGRKRALSSMAQSLMKNADNPFAIGMALSGVGQSMDMEKAKQTQQFAAERELERQQVTDRGDLASSMFKEMQVDVAKEERQKLEVFGGLLEQGMDVDQAMQTAGLNRELLASKMQDKDYFRELPFKVQELGIKQMQAEASISAQKSAAAQRAFTNNRLMRNDFLQSQQQMQSALQGMAEMAATKDAEQNVEMVMQRYLESQGRPLHTIPPEMQEELRDKIRNSLYQQSLTKRSKPMMDFFISAQRDPFDPGYETGLNSLIQGTAAPAFDFSAPGLNLGSPQEGQ